MTDASAHVDSPAQRLLAEATRRLSAAPGLKDVDARQQALFGMVAERMVALRNAGLTPVDIRVHSELAKKAEIENLTMLYALPVVVTLLYREQGFVVTGAFL